MNVNWWSSYVKQIKIGKKTVLAKHKPLSISTRDKQFGYFKDKRAMLAISVAIISYSLSYTHAKC